MLRHLEDLIDEVLAFTHALFCQISIRVPSQVQRIVLGQNLTSFTMQFFLPLMGLDHIYFDGCFVGHSGDLRETFGHLDRVNFEQHGGRRACRIVITAQISNVLVARFVLLSLHEVTHFVLTRPLRCQHPAPTRIVIIFICVEWLLLALIHIQGRLHLPWLLLDDFKSTGASTILILV